MFRFIMPDPSLPFPAMRESLRTQFEAFAHSDALRELFALLDADRRTLGTVYGGRAAAGGSVRETQELRPLEALEPYREALYPLFRELGLVDINRPLRDDYSRILVLGGSLGACRSRTAAAAEWVTPSVRRVDGLSCYRPINPAERRASAFQSSFDTEFGVLSDAFASVFGLTGQPEDLFHGDRNLNRISCVRTFPGSGGDCSFHVFAAPSTQPEERRADTGDTLRFYLQQTPPDSSDSLLAVTNNRHCNGQFLQLAYDLCREGVPVRLDVIGCSSDKDVTRVDQYDPYLYLQELIRILDWIDRFDQLP